MIEIANEEVDRRGGGRVSALHLKLGPLSGVIKAALTFSYEIACVRTALAGSRLIIEEVPVVIHCLKCGQDDEVDSIQSLRCRRCGELSFEVLQGREWEVVALELEEVEELVS